MVSRAAIALMAERLSSSCFSYSCFTELAFVFDCTVERSGSISLSMPAKPVRQVIQFLIGGGGGGGGIIPFFLGGGGG